jgi:nitronate monooxygenase
MWPRSDFLELLGITHPMVQAPMSGFATPALAAAVCNAGGWVRSAVRHYRH